MKKHKRIYHDVDFEIFPNKYKRTLELLANTDRTIRLEARNELEKIGIDIIPHLAVVLYFDDHKIRWEAAKTLEVMARDEGINIQIEALEDEESDIRWIASEGLIRMGRKSIMPLLEVLEKEGTDSAHLISAAHHVLNKIDVDKEIKEKLKPLVKALNNKRLWHEIPVLVNNLKLELR